MENEVVLDMRGLEPPEPLERVLEALSVLEPGRRLRMLIDRQPRPLYRILGQNGYAYEEAFRPDFVYEVVITHKI